MDESLRDFLARCRQDWGAADLRSVLRKLHTVGLKDVHSLLRAVEDGSINIKLEAFGERTFTSSTLAAFRAECDQQQSTPSKHPNNPEPSVDELLADARRRARSQEVPGVTKFFRTEVLTGESASSASLTSEMRSGSPKVAPRSEQPQQQEYPKSFSFNTNNEQEEQDLLYREMKRTIQVLDRAADNARKRNAKLSSGLSEAQAGIGRIQESLRRARVHTTAAQSPPKPTHFSGTRAHPSVSATPSTSSTPQPRPSSAPRNARQASKRSPSAPPGGTTSTPPYNRGSQSGFTFGDGRSVKQPTQSPSQVRSALETVRAEMRAARSKSVAERRDKLRELQLRWHPDKNPHSEAEATAVFQLIQSEKGLLGL